MIDRCADPFGSVPRPDLAEALLAQVPHLPVERETRVDVSLGVQEERIPACPAGEQPFAIPVVPENTGVEIGSEPSLRTEALEFLAHDVVEFALQLARFDLLVSFGREVEFRVLGYRCRELKSDLPREVVYGAEMAYIISLRCECHPYVSETEGSELLHRVDYFLESPIHSTYFVVHLSDAVERHGDALGIDRAYRRHDHRV